MNCYYCGRVLHFEVEHDFGSCAECLDAIIAGVQIDELDSDFFEFLWLLRDVIGEYQDAVTG